MWLNALSCIADLVWSAPVVFALLGVYWYISRCFGFPQKRISDGIRTAFSGNGAVLRSLSVSLAAVLGVGNIVGVAMAITLGGPGAVFWCWVAGIAGMGVQYAECLCSLRHRASREAAVQGGPMVTLHCLGFRGSARLYAAAAVLCGLTMGAMIPSNAIRTVLAPQGNGIWWLAAVLTCLSAMVILGGARRIYEFCVGTVPVLVICYLAACGVILVICRAQIGEALARIFREAFLPSGFAAGTVGYGIGRAMRWGVARGLFSSEAGLGTAGISAAAEADTSIETQALGCACQSVWDTMILATLTGITFVAAACRLGHDFSDPMLLAQEAFALIPGVGKWLLPVFLIILGFSTIIGWYSIARQTYLFLTGGRYPRLFAWFWLAAVFAGVFLMTDLAWTMSDLFSMLMLLPNLRMILMLRPNKNTIANFNPVC